MKSRKKNDNIFFEKNDNIFFEKNENLILIEKAGKIKKLSNEEIKKEKNKVQLMEDMNTLGTITKEEILKEKKSNPEKFYSTEEIIQQKETNDDLFALGVFSKALENQGMVTAIEKNSNNNQDNTKLAETTLQFLINGMSNKMKYDFHFDFGEKRNNDLLNDEKERKLFHDKLRKKLSKEYNIEEEDIIITFPRKGSYMVTVIFKSKDFSLNKSDLLKKFQKEKDELGLLKDIESGIILGGCKLRPEMLDNRGNNKDGGWAPDGEKRGGELYLPPKGWIGYGLKVLDVYSDNNNWIGMNNGPGEWSVAYHGVARAQNNPKEVSKIAGLIVTGGFKPSTWGKAADDPDLRHPGKKCGHGVYCTPDINYAEQYAGITELNNEKYKCVLMLRVNPKKIRQSSTYQKEYILEPDPNEIRPYRILLKKV